MTMQDYDLTYSIIISQNYQGFKEKTPHLNSMSNFGNLGKF